MEIKFEYEMENIVFVRKISKALKEIEQKFVDEFGETKKKLVCNFKVFPTREDYKKWKGYGDKYKNWMVGDFDGKNTIAIIYYKDSGRTEKDMVQVACHELSHFLLAKHFKVKSEVLDEGLACYLAGQMPCKNLENPPSIKMLDENFADNGGYTFAPIYVWYLIQKFGKKLFIKLLKKKKIYKFIPKNFEVEAIEEYKKTNQID